VLTTNFDQRALDAPSPKPARLVYFAIDLSDLIGRRIHRRRWCEYKDRGGKAVTKWARLPLSAGVADGSISFLTKAAAACPFKLNFTTTKAIVARGRHILPCTNTSSPGLTTTEQDKRLSDPAWPPRRSADLVLSKAHKPSTTSQRRRENQHAVGGTSRPVDSLSCLQSQIDRLPDNGSDRH
jgi:hypothetical protein